MTLAGMHSPQHARPQAPRSYSVSNWLNGSIQTQFRTIDGLSIRFAESDRLVMTVTAPPRRRGPCYE